MEGGRRDGGGRGVGGMEGEEREGGKAKGNYGTAESLLPVTSANLKTF